MPQAAIDTTRAYRLPWSLNDNVLGWLEPTKKCNLYCEGCYSTNEAQSHKSLEQVRADLDVFVSRRRLDSISIAGGDPLTHPQIVEIVRIITEDYGLKAVVNTNGLALDPALLRALKHAGVHGFTFHIDSSQKRPHWKEKTEQQLNALRLHYAEMVAREGGLTCAFNATLFRHTLDEVPGLVRWAAEHIDIVHGMVFILFRTSRAREFSYFAHGREVDVEDLAYYGQERNPAPLTVDDIVPRILEADPDYLPSAFLGGTKDPNSAKWVLAARIGRPGRIYGYTGPRTMELVQAGHHLLFGRYLAYSHPDLLAAGRSTALGLWPLDPVLRRAAGRILRSPRDRAYTQSIAIIQPIDMMPDGEMNMCDGCPDMTVHEGTLVWSCRLDERKHHGCFLTAAPRC